MDYDFDTRKALTELKSILDNYEIDEEVEKYAKETFIADVIFFLGKAVDKEKYGYDARAFRDFLAIEIYEMANAAHKSRKNQFARRLGMH